MNILIVSQYFWPENFRINAMATSLVCRGHQVDVLAGIPNYPEGKFFTGYGLFSNFEEYKGVHIVRVPIIPRGRNSKIKLALNYVSYVISACLLGPLWCKKKYDVIFVFQMSPVTMGIPAILLKKIKKVPIFFWVQDLWPDSVAAVHAVKSKIVFKILNIMVKFIYSRCDRILIQSKAFSSAIEKFGVNNNKILYFPNSAESIYRPVKIPSDAPERLLVPQGFNIMFAGNIGVAQDFESIIEAADLIKEHEGINWVIVGEGRMRSWVEKEITKRGLGGSVYCVGKYPMDKMPYFFSLADVMLVTLKQKPIFSLTIPSKIQSYLACGKPILASIEGEGAKIIKESRSGIVCSPENPVELSRSVMRLYQMEKNELNAMGDAGRKYFIKNFKEDVLINKFEQWIHDFCSKN